MRIVGTQEKDKIRPLPQFCTRESPMLIVDFVGVVRGVRGPTHKSVVYCIRVLNAFFDTRVLQTHPHAVTNA